MRYIDATDLIEAHEKTDYLTIKKNIRYYMQQRHISSQSVSDAIGIKLSTSHAYKNLSNAGKPELKNLMKFAEFFGISVYDLLKPTEVFYKEYESVL
jgi:transcriptional regulator with XRE-family HTH domain